jgi:hypothetical protein
MTKPLKAAIGVIGFLLVLVTVFEAQAGIWCPTPIPGVLIKYCLCQSLTGRAEVSSPSPLSPLTLFGLWRDLGQAARRIGHPKSQPEREREDFFRNAGDGHAIERKSVG